MGMMLAVVPGWGAIVTYSNTLATANNYNTNYNTIRTMWEATLANQATVNFETATVADTPGVLVHSGSGYSVQSTCPVLAANESCIADWNWSTTPATSYSRVRSSVSPMPSGLRYFHGAAGNSNGIEIRLPSGTLSFAADLWTTNLAARTIYVELWSPTNSYLGAYSVPTNNSTTAAFIGFVSDTALGRIVMSVGSSGSMMVDRYDFNGAAVATPESASLSYVGIGIAAILVGSSKRRLH
jgi:hypothetical protein